MPTSAWRRQGWPARPQDGLPPGTVFVAVVTPERTETAALELTGDRSRVMDQTVAEALRLLGAVLQPESPGLG
ncbi:MAG: CinA family protein [Nocardioides sp.]